MSVLKQSADSMWRGILRTFPKGVIWGTGTRLAKYAHGVSPTFMRAYNNLIDVWEESDPTTTSALLQDWLTALGLPDALSPVLTTTAEQRAAVQGKLASSGGQAASYMESVCAKIGAPVTIVEPLGGTGDYNACDMRCDAYTRSKQWAYVFEVHYPNPALLGRIQAAIEFVKPAHTKAKYITP